MKFQKKPIVIEAWKFLGRVDGELPKGVCDCGRTLEGIPGGCQPHVHTAHNNQRVDLEVGDWIIPEPDGKHFYPCKPDIFAATYDPVEPIFKINNPTGDGRKVDLSPGCYIDATGTDSCKVSTETINPS